MKHEILKRDKNATRRKNSLNFKPFQYQGLHVLPLLLLPLEDPSGSQILTGCISTIPALPF